MSFAFRRNGWSLERALAAYAIGLVLACIVVHLIVHGTSAKRGEAIVVIESAWQKGELIARTEGEWPLGKAASFATDVTLVRESIVNEGPIVTSSEIAFGLSLVPGRDGVKCTLNGKTAYLTPDDLLARQAYDHGIGVPSLTLSFGADVPLIEAMLADRLGATVPDIHDHASIRRIRTERLVHPPAAPVSSSPSEAASESASGSPVHRAHPREGTVARITPETITADLVRDAALDAARFLARGVDENGRFRYMVDATTNRTLGGYDWPRHAGATYFLAQAYGISHEPALAFAALKAAALLRDHAVTDCGNAKCIGTDDIVDLGSSALALVAFVEVVRTKLDEAYLPLVVSIGAFVRQQQRADGEFMHRYDRIEHHPIDEQLLYYSGEATLGLSRAYAITRDPLLLEAAKKGLAHLVGPAWSFFGDRYYFGEEHWTCQALADLWDDAPNADALDFCERWHAYGRNMMFGPGDSPFDADGAFGVGPLVTPRITPVASRCEAAAATLDAARRAHGDAREIDALDHQLRRSLALILREQLRPGLTHLFADPDAVYGAIPGSLVDWQLRIDYAQHAGSAMIRTASLLSPER